jgi:hypothetical protein
MVWCVRRSCSNLRFATTESGNRRCCWIFDRAEPKRAAAKRQQLLRTFRFSSELRVPGSSHRAAEPGAAK